MADVTIEAGTLLANRQERIVSGLLLPYGEVGKTNLGRFSIAPGAVTIPTDPSVVTLNVEHTREEPVGRAVSLTDTPAGVVATFSVASTPEGDRYLEEVENGTRNGLSAEVAEIELSKDKRKAIRGRLFAAAACVAGAFPSATLLASEAGDAADLEAALAAAQDALADIQSLLTPKNPDDAASPDEAPAGADTEAPVAENDAPAPEQDDDKTLKASLAPGLGGKGKRSATLFASLAGKAPNVAATMMASLDQITAADALPAQQAQWLGEVYGSKTYQRRFANLVQHGDLQALKAIGWKFTEGKTPEVDDYAGFPAQPYTNEVKTEAVTLDAQRIAGAGAVDRAFLDFPMESFWAGYFREQTNSYERQLDAKALEAYLAAAQIADPILPPDGVSTAAAYIVRGARSIIDAERDLPAWAIVGSDLYEELLLTRADDVLAYLSAALNIEDGQGFGPFKIVPSAHPDLIGGVLVGTRSAATVFELPGSPVRVDTVSIATGGVERGVFGYHAELINDASGLVLVGGVPES